MCAICPSKDGDAGMIGKISVCGRCYNLYATRANEKNMVVAMDEVIEKDQRMIDARKQIERLEARIGLLEEFLKFIDYDWGSRFNNWFKNRASR